MNKFPKLTPKQLAFAHARISGKNQTDAARIALPKNRLSANGLYVEAHKLDKHPKIRAYIAAALAESRSEVLLTRDKKRLILGSIAQDARAHDNSRIAAVKVDNDMTGDNAPVRIEGEITLHAIFTALTPATTLPTAMEIALLKPAEIVQLPEPLPEKTAMERAQ